MLEQLASVLGDALSVVLGILVDKNSLLSGLGLVKDISALQAFKAADLMAAFKNATPEERAAADAAFKAAVNLKDASLVAKIDAGEMDIERAVDLVMRAIQIEKDAVQLINDVKVFAP